MRKLRKIVRNLPLIGNGAKWAFRKIVPLVDYPEYWIDRYIKNGDKTIVQIGSNDGVTTDPLHSLILKNKKWKAILVEPVPYLFERLKNNYPDDKRIMFENAAISDGATQVFYSVKPEAGRELPGLPVGWDQLGSFLRSNISNAIGGILVPYILETEIKGLTLQSLFNKYNLEQLNVLHIDTEGYDWKVLAQLDFSRFNPEIILLEHSQLEDDEKDCVVSFLRQRFCIFSLGTDFLNIRKDIIRMEDKKFLRSKWINPD